MIREDFHVHTCFSDGADTPETMVRAAIARGMTAIGFSDHSHTAFDESYCMPLEKNAQYRDTVRALAEQYRDQIRVYCGIEQDLYADVPTVGYDYVIGSVHYLHIGDAYIPVDETPQILREAVRDCFGGDWYALAECYFREVSRVAEVTGADIIGHFDLIRKFNRGGALFSEEHPRYLAAARQAADVLLKTGALFEINTGAISRGYQTEAYPADAMVQYLADRGARFIASSDSHRADTLCYGFDQLSAVSHQLSVSHQPSAISHQGQESGFTGF